MNVKQIKELLPLSEVHEISPDSRYFIQVPREMGIQAVMNFADILKKMGFDDNVLIVMGEMQIFEMPKSAPVEKLPSIAGRCLP